MHSRRVSIVFVILIAGVGVSTAILFAEGLVAPGVLGGAIVACLLVGCGLLTAKRRRSADHDAASFDVPKPAIAPPDGHIRFTLVVEGLEPDRIAELWSDLCRPDRGVTEE